MGILESILNQKRWEEEQRRADMNMLATGIQHIGETKQRQQLVDLKRLETQAALNKLNKDIEDRDPEKIKARIESAKMMGANAIEADLGGVKAGFNQTTQPAFADVRTPENMMISEFEYNTTARQFMPKFKSKDAPRMSPALENYKNKRIEDIMGTIEQGNVQRALISDAMESAKKIQSGIYGKISRGTMKNLDPNNPLLGDWQKIKMVLADATLMNTAKTKGAISDKEMGEFQSAAANDDLASLPRMIPVFNRVLKSLNATETGKIKAYKKMYNEDPYTWEGISSNINDVKEMEDMTDGKQLKQNYKVGQTIKRGNKTYKIVGFDTDGDPLVE